VAANTVGQSASVLGPPTPFPFNAYKSIDLGDNTLNPVQGPAFSATNGNQVPVPSSFHGQLPSPSVFVAGTDGTPVIPASGVALSGDAFGFRLQLGNNLSVPGVVNSNNAGEPLGWPVKIQETVLGSLVPVFFLPPILPFPFGTGNAIIGPTAQSKLERGQNQGFSGFGILSPAGQDNGLALFISPTVVQGDFLIFMGSGDTFNARTETTMYGTDFVWLGVRPDVTIFPGLSSAFGFVGGTGPSGGVPGTQPPTPGADFLQIGSGVGQPAQGSAELQVVLGNHRT